MMFLAKCIVALPLSVFFLLGVLLAVLLGVLIAGLMLTFQALTTLTHRLSNQ